MGKSSPPPPPDPKETAAASMSTNVGTAIANAQMGNVNQVTPYGSLTYSQTGSYKWTDPYTGQTYNIPTFTATQELAPEQQAILDQVNQARLNLGEIAANQSGFLEEHLSQPFEYNNRDVENWIYDLASARMDPRFQQQEEALRTRLLNSGIREGSEAWNREMMRFEQGRNDAYNSLMLQGRGQAMQEALAHRNQPINELTALLSGSQVTNPNFIPTNMPTIPTTDVAGLINQDYQNRLAQWQAEQAASGGLLSGLGSLAGSLISIAKPASVIGLSDDDAKKDKERLGDIEKGMGLWEFRYKGEPRSKPKHLGLMASEVEKVKPSAVKKGKDGKRRVDYGKALGLMEMA